jgi:hypothetical protein
MTVAEDFRNNALNVMVKNAGGRFKGMDEA